MPPKASKRKAANGYKLPDHIPEGTIISGIGKNPKQFRLGKSIGTGGFGEIYLASEDISRPVKDDATLAMKIEPHENGPLFVEMNFYIRSAQPHSVEEFKKAKNLKSFGMPCLRGNGSHVHKGEKYRFLVMDRFGKDLQKIFQTGKKLFTDKVTYNLALKVLDVLEFIHSKGYCHNDIKAQNMLLGYGRTKENDVYLVDFGLVSKYQKEGVHYEYKPDARKAHDGTIEYTSRDAHIGAHARRSDLEILAYNLVHWMSGELPWMDKLTDPTYVQKQKIGYMNDIKAFLQRCFQSEDYPAVLEEFLNYVVSLEFDTPPDYDMCRQMFKTALTKAKYPLDGKIDFTSPKKAPKKGRKRKASDFEDLDFSEEIQNRKSSRIIRNNSENGRVSVGDPTPAASPTPDDVSGWSWERILNHDPESILRQSSRQSESEDESVLALQHKALDDKRQPAPKWPLIKHVTKSLGITAENVMFTAPNLSRQKESWRNPTDAMLQIHARILEREKEREQMTWQQQLHHFSKSNKSASQSPDHNPDLLTPAMKEVIQMRQDRVSIEIDTPITPEPSDLSSQSDDSESDLSSHEEYSPKRSPVKKRSPKAKNQSPNRAKRVAKAKQMLGIDESDANVEPVTKNITKEKKRVARIQREQWILNQNLADEVSQDMSKPLQEHEIVISPAQELQEKAKKARKKGNKKPPKPQLDVDTSLSQEAPIAVEPDVTPKTTKRGRKSKKIQPTEPLVPEATKISAEEKVEKPKAKRGRKPKHQPSENDPRMGAQPGSPTKVGTLAKPLQEHEVLVPEPQTQSVDSTETKPRTIKRNKKSANATKARENRKKEPLAVSFDHDDSKAKPHPEQEASTSEIQTPVVETKPQKRKRSKKSAKPQHIPDDGVPESEALPKPTEFEASSVDITPKTTKKAKKVAKLDENPKPPRKYNKTKKSAKLQQSLEDAVPEDPDVSLDSTETNPHREVLTSKLQKAPYVDITPKTIKRANKAAKPEQNSEKTKSRKSTKKSVKIQETYEDMAVPEPPALDTDNANLIEGDNRDLEANEDKFQQEELEPDFDQFRAAFVEITPRTYSRANKYAKYQHISAVLPPDLHRALNVDDYESQDEDEDIPAQEEHEYVTIPKFVKNMDVKFKGKGFHGFRSPYESELSNSSNSSSSSSSRIGGIEVMEKMVEVQNELDKVQSELEEVQDELLDSKEKVENELLEKHSIPEPQPIDPFEFTDDEEEVGTIEQYRSPLKMVVNATLNKIVSNTAEEFTAEELINKSELKDHKSPLPLSPSAKETKPQKIKKTKKSVELKNTKDIEVPSHQALSLGSHENEDEISMIQAPVVETKPQKIKRVKKSAKIQHVHEDLVQENEALLVNSQEFEASTADIIPKTVKKSKKVAKPRHVHEDLVPKDEAVDSQEVIAPVIINNEQTKAANPGGIKRRISIQNDVTPITNVEPIHDLIQPPKKKARRGSVKKVRSKSTEQPPTSAQKKSSGRGRGRPRKASQAEQLDPILSEIPTTEFIEVTAAEDNIDPEVAFSAIQPPTVVETKPRKISKTKKSVKRQNTNEVEQPDHQALSVDSHDNVDAVSRVQATAIETKPKKIKRAKKSAKIQHVHENLVPENDSLLVNSQESEASTVDSNTKTVKKPKKVAKLEQNPKTTKPRKYNKTKKSAKSQETLEEVVSEDSEVSFDLPENNILQEVLTSKLHKTSSVDITPKTIKRANKAAKLQQNQNTSQPKKRVKKAAKPQHYMASENIELVSNELQPQQEFLGPKLQESYVEMKPMIIKRERPSLEMSETEVNVGLDDTTSEDFETVATTSTSKPKAMQNLVKRQRKMPTTLKINDPSKNKNKGKSKKGTKSPRKSTRASDENMRTTRAKENTQKWENLLNNEEILKRK